MTNPAIIILDDTTSAVDMETESRIQEALAHLPKKKTVFIIAHRISSVKDADKILVLDHGKLVEQGTHQELMKQQGYYATVFEHQYGEYHKLKQSQEFQEYLQNKGKHLRRKEEIFYGTE